MILCRLFIGFKNVSEDGNETEVKDLIFGNMGKNQTVYVIDELAIKGFGKHAENLHLAPKASDVIKSEFRDIDGYTTAGFIDKVIKPVILQEHFGISTNISFSTIESLREFSKFWLVAVNIPETARAIPDGSTGVLVPRPYESSEAPEQTRVLESIDGISVD